MSTRANIILKEGKDKLFFYRHSDGYPKGTLPTLNKFVEWMKEGHIRSNVQQAAGWLIMLGALEYSTIPDYKTETVERYRGTVEEIDFNTIGSPKDWKVGAYEPTTCIHGDIEYLYTIDLNTKEIKVETVDFNYTTKKHTFHPATADDLK